MLCDLHPPLGLKLPLAQQMTGLASDSLLLSMFGHCSWKKRLPLAKFMMFLNGLKPQTDECMGEARRWLVILFLFGQFGGNLSDTELSTGLFRPCL